MKQCLVCGTENFDQDIRCGVCQESLTVVDPRTISRPANTRFSNQTRRRFHVKGLAGLLVSVGLIVIGILLIPDSGMGPLGFFFLFIGILAVGSIISVFKGLPYQPNSGWHTAGDPDVVATSTRGSPPSGYSMFQVDRELENKKREEESD